LGKGAGVGLSAKSRRNKTNRTELVPDRAWGRKPQRGGRRREAPEEPGGEPEVGWEGTGLILGVPSGPDQVTPGGQRLSRIELRKMVGGRAAWGGRAGRGDRGKPAGRQGPTRGDTWAPG